MNLFVNGIKADSFNIKKTLNRREWRSWWEPDIVHVEKYPDDIYATVTVAANFDFGVPVTIKAIDDNGQSVNYGDFYICSKATSHNLGISTYELESVNNIHIGYSPTALVY